MKMKFYPCLKQTWTDFDIVQKIRSFFKYFKKEVRIIPIDADESISFEGIHISLKNSTAGLNGTNQHIINIQMPNEDVTLKFYCSVGGHEEAGMVGKIVVGAGSTEVSAPGFEILPLTLGLMAAIVIGSILRKNHNL